MTTSAPTLIGTRLSHRTIKLIWFAFAAVALAIVLAVTIVSTASTDHTQTTANVAAAVHKSGHGKVPDCRPTRVVHYC